jgi:hypothetical protein
VKKEALRSIKRCSSPRFVTKKILHPNLVPKIRRPEITGKKKRLNSHRDTSITATTTTSFICDVEETSQGRGRYGAATGRPRGFERGDYSCRSRGDSVVAHRSVCDSYARVLFPRRYWAWWIFRQLAPSPGLFLPRSLSLFCDWETDFQDKGRRLCLATLKRNDIGWKSPSTFRSRNGISTTCSGGDWIIRL